MPIKLKQLSFRFPIDKWRAIKLYCALNDVSMQNFITSAIESEMAKRKIKVDQ